MYRRCDRFGSRKVARTLARIGVWSHAAVGPPPFHATASATAVRRKNYASTPMSFSNGRNEKSDLYSQSHSMPETNLNPSMALPSDEELFNFTRGRFVSNEQHELSQRHRAFNVLELARLAAQAVQASHCLSIKKCPDGMYNRVLLLSMDNGREVIAKIPNPNSGQPHFTTASEVATMEFVSTPAFAPYNRLSSIPGTRSVSHPITQNIRLELQGARDCCWCRIYLDGEIERSGARMLLTKYENTRQTGDR